MRLLLIHHQKILQFIQLSREYLSIDDTVERSPQLCNDNIMTKYIYCKTILAVFLEDWST